MRRAANLVVKSLAVLVALLCLAAAIVPLFLDRIYYRGGASGHFDGARFFNPDGDDTSAPPGGGSRGGFLMRQLTGSDARPPWPDAVPIRPATARELTMPAPRAGTEPPMRVTWVGHATVLVQVAGLNILTDPVWSDNAGPFGFGPRRVARPGIAFADLPRIDLVLISHNHYDHMDLATLERLWRRDRPMIVTSLGNDAILRARGIGVTALDWGEALPVVARPAIAAHRRWPGSVRVHVTRNHHWGSRWFADRNRALWSSFVVELPGGNLFFAGDTGFGDGRWVDEARAIGPIRLALIPIGAFRFVPGQMASGSHIGPVDAVEVHRRLGAATAIPIHWGTFRLSYERWDTPPRLLAAATRCTGQRGFVPVAIGRPVDVDLARTRRDPPISREALLACLNTPAVRALD